MNKAIFLDRDGTISKDVHYCSRPEDLQFLPTVEEGLRALSKSEFKIIVVTNQSGIARGYFTEETLGRIHEKLEKDIVAAGGRIDAIYYCPHHPDNHCNCRKPNAGMLEKAAEDWDIDLARSYFIGDKYLDIEAAHRVKCRAVLVPSEEPEIGWLQERQNIKGIVDFISPDFETASRWILDNSNNITLEPDKRE